MERGATERDAVVEAVISRGTYTNVKEEYEGRI